MTDQLKASIDAIFDRHDAAKRAAVAAAEKRKSDEELFVDMFIDARAAVIRPALERVADLVKARGYQCEVTESDGEPDGRGGKSDPSVTLTILLDKPDQHQRQPHLSAICDRLQRRVRFHESTMTPGRGGHAGPAGEAALPSVTDELVFTKAVKFIGEVFR